MWEKQSRLIKALSEQFIKTEIEIQISNGIKNLTKLNCSKLDIKRLKNSPKCTTAKSTKSRKTK